MKSLLFKYEVNIWDPLIRMESINLLLILLGRLRAWKLKKNPLAHWASKNFFHLPSSNSYLPRIYPAQILTCPGFANRIRSPIFNFVLTRTWNQDPCKSQIIEYTEWWGLQWHKLVYCFFLLKNIDNGHSLRQFEAPQSKFAAKIRKVLGILISL